MTLHDNAVFRDVFARRTAGTMHAFLLGMFKTTRYEEKSRGDYAFNKYGNPSFEVSVPRPQQSTKTTTEVIQFGFLWSVSIKSALAACKAQSEGELVALGATKLRALEPGEED